MSSVNARFAAGARECEQLAEEHPEERADYLCEAAEHWYEAGDNARADMLFQQAIAAGGATGGIDPQVSYAAFLVAVGESERARELLDEVWRKGGDNPSAYEMGGEIFEVDFEEPEVALRWYTGGIARVIDPADPPEAADLLDDSALGMLFSARSRVRKQLGQPEDQWDELWNSAYAIRYQGRSPEDVERELFRAAEEMRRPRRAVQGTLLYWPREQLAEYLRRWPGAYPGFEDEADPHERHRREVESTLRGSDDGMPLAVAIAEVAGFVEYVDEHADLRPDEPEARASYAAELGRLGKGSPWPPGRNDPCWCGSGRKYKKCCGAPGFADPG
ncbi:SEC-C domain-containing protein [Amycolatopsis anabasis]|uniref:SEC-C domain-containing protein n=1 Tax=Amycolatopsis anabasis TaxID=1840409 RepID=UPI00131BDB48|nr:SEC-C domain-containing protein [Amycolatopsis anabasis]